MNLSIQDLDSLQRTIEDAANRRTLGTVIAALILGAAIVSTAQQTPQLQILSEIFFVIASLIGLWLTIGIIRSGRSR